MKTLVLCLLLSACSPPTPAQEVTILRAELLVMKAKCASYILDAKYPRDSRLDTDCGKLTEP